MTKRNIFYPDGTMIPIRMPDHFEKSTSKSACGNCGMYSNRRSFCGIYKTAGVKDTYICWKWRERHFKR
tara:strand:- start:1014 stop:1220 length:207 start_codon:yes stop_codon:yes gene_type:complete